MESMLYKNRNIFLDIPREQTLCFTGHRPEKLPEGKLFDALLGALHYHIDDAVEKGCLFFLDGMADGIDYLAADYLFRKRKENPQIRVIGIQPCENYQDFFRCRHYDLKHLEHMQNAFDDVICLPGNYIRQDGRKNDALFRNRNCFLVDHSSALIAVCSQGRSGSWQTVEYARKQKIPICRLEANPSLLYTPAPEQWPVERINF